MSARLSKRIEQLERLVADRGSDDHDDSDALILIPEILIAGREKCLEGLRNSQATADDSPERLEELQRRGNELRDWIESRQRLRRILKRKRR